LRFAADPSQAVSNITTLLQGTSMRRLASLLVPVLALSACVRPYYGPEPDGDGYRSSSDRWYDAADVPLAARIEQTGIGYGIRLNRPAYVAMFEILPGQGVGLYYPSYQPERAFFPTGFSSLPTHGARRFDSYFTGMPSVYRRGEPRFYFLVASKRPLRSITRFQRSEGSLRSVLGLTAYSSMNYRRVMDDLVQAVVPPQSDDDWTTDVLAIWPRSDGYYADNGGYTRVYCGDGTVEVLPIELSRWGCMRQRRPIVVRAPRVATDPPPSSEDTVTVRPPTRRRPQPADGATEGAAEGGRVAVPERRPGHPEAADPAAPRVRPGGGETEVAPAASEGEDARTPRVEPRERPRPESPAPEPRQPREPRSEPRSETPRPTPRETPRTEPRAETPRPTPTPRSETPRSEPRSEAPRPAPVRNDPPPARSEPAPAPAPSRPERPAPESPPTS
jgi:hypothetical protein